MNIKVELVPSKEYFESCYQDWLPRSNMKWLPYVSMGLILLGILFYIFNDSNRFRGIPIFAPVWGIVLFIQYYYKKKRWIKERMKSNIVGKKQTLIFKEEHIEHNGPYSKGIVKWETFQEYFLTENGLTLVPEHGIFIFLPRSVFEREEDILQIEEKLKLVIAKK